MKVEVRFWYTLFIFDSSYQQFQVIRARAIAQKNTLVEEVARLKGEVKGMDDKRVRAAPTVGGSVGSDGVG